MKNLIDFFFSFLPDIIKWGAKKIYNFFTSKKKLQKENEELKAQINELKLTISDHEATIERLQKKVNKQEEPDYPQQTDTGFSEYMKW